MAAYITEVDRTEAYIAGLLHDIGKVCMLDIINKPQKLKYKETLLIKKHPIYSANILRKLRFSKNITNAVRYHHERLDGSGYYGYKDIPLLSRMVAIADVFDAVTNPRPYKRPYDYDYAISILKSEKYDQDVLKVFTKIAVERKDLIREGIAL